MTNHPVCFIAFDIIYKKTDLKDLPLLTRKKILDSFPESDVFIRSKYVLEKGIKLFTKVQEKGLEGIVAKRIHSKYEEGMRSKEWIKIKNFIEENFYIGAYVNDDNVAMIKLYLGEFKNKEFHFVGKVMTPKKGKIYTSLLKSIPKRSSPFIDFREDNITYIEPRFICTIMYLERTKNNHLRHAVFKNE